jgi:hypothetical protein
MKRAFSYLLAGSAALLVSAQANAAVLFEQAGLTSGAYSFDFVAGDASTTIDFGGYDLPSYSYARDISLVLQGSGTNLLGATFTFTPASCGSIASQGGLGAAGTNDLRFGGTCAGFYDSFAQSVATTVGSTYTLAFNLAASGASANGLRVSASNTLAVDSAVPEPATWAMMLVGFAAIGMGMRRRQQQTVRYTFA